MNRRIPIRTLIIDDDELLCRKLHGWLEAAAYEPVTFAKPDEALRNAAQVQYHLALVALRLSETEGTAVIAALRQTSPHTRVVAMTAFPETPQVLAAFRAGARDLLEKPVQQSTLLETLDRQLRESGVAVRTEEEFNGRLGAKLRALRNESGRRLRDVAAAGGLTAAQLSQIETGKTATSTWTLARLCGALQTPLAELFKGF